MSDVNKIVELIKRAYGRCNNTSCFECEYYGLGKETCEHYNLAYYLIQNGFGVLMKDGEDK